MLELLRETIRVGLTRGATVREVAAKARGLGRGLTIGQGIPDLTPIADELMREVDPLLPNLAPAEINARQMGLRA